MSSDIVLGIVTVLMTILGALLALHPPDSLKRHVGWKAFYLVSFLALGVVAITYVIKQSRETTSVNQRLTNALTDLNHSTDEIARVTSLNTSLQQQLLGQSTRISKLAEESFRTIIGADSFPYIAPQPAPYPGPVPLVVWDHGKYMLTGVTLTIRRSDDFQFYHQPLDIGILHPGWGKTVSATIQPNPDSKTGEDIFLVEMYTQSEFFTEVIHFRKSHDGKYWAYSFWVTQAKFGSKKEKPTPRPKLPHLAPNSSVTFTVYDRSKWSDEPLDQPKK